MNPDIICLGELLVEIMRDGVNVPHRMVGASYRGPFPSGAPAIFIDTVARMTRDSNLKAGFIGVVGDDEFGDCVIRKLKQDNIDLSHVRISKTLTTGIAFNQYNSDGSRKFIFAPGAAGDTSPNDIDKEYFSNIKALHIMGSSLSISQSSRDACYKAIKVVKLINPQAIISFDPNLRPEMLDIDIILKICKPVLKEANILLPSGEEAEMLSGIEGQEAACMELLKGNPKMVILKEGRLGATIFSDALNEPIQLPSFNVEEIDPTGAGDSFGGAFISSYLQGWDLKKSLQFANAVGALKVNQFGPMPDTTIEEVLELIEKLNQVK
ncbi:MAG: sugar kinase [Promethearchaeota archaeon]|nr:MAG: sugar kinase [Candidatus Lokiarchaeota archaeon]